jgi:hypothetical protein
LSQDPVTDEVTPESATWQSSSAFEEYRGVIGSAKLAIAQAR